MIDNLLKIGWLFCSEKVLSVFEKGFDIGKSITNKVLKTKVLNCLFSGLKWRGMCKYMILSDKIVKKLLKLGCRVYINIDRGRGVCYIFSILRGTELLSFIRAFTNKENILGCHQGFFLEV
jgi:hypothetical protein